MAEGREAMLRPEFREWYPALRADWWYPAQRLADLVVEQRRFAEPRWEFESRVPSDEHFLFRGGHPRGSALLRTRGSDRAQGTTSPEATPAAEP